MPPPSFSPLLAAAAAAAGLIDSSAGRQRHYPRASLILCIINQLRAAEKKEKGKRSELSAEHDLLAMK